MRIAGIIEESRWGGPQKRATMIAEALQKYDIDTIVIAPKAESSEFCGELKKSNVKHYTIEIKTLGSGFMRIAKYFLYFIFDIYRLFKLISRLKVDLVHISGGAWQYKGMIAGKLAKSKVIWHLNDTYMPFIIKRVFSLLSGFADAYIFASERTKKYYFPLLNKKRLGFIIPQPVDTSYFSTNIIQNRNDDTLVYQNKIVIGTVASINPVKGLEVLIEAIPRLNKYFNNLLFIVVGPVYESQNKYFNSLKAKILELDIHNIQFVGAQKDVKIFLEKFDIFVCTSFYESGPMTLWEAMSMEKAVVTTDVGDVSKYVLSGHSGEVVKVGDIDGLVDKISVFILDEKKRNSFGTHAREIVNENLNVSICAQKHLEAYQSVIEL